MNAFDFVFVPEYGYSVTKRQTVYQDESFKAQIHFTKLETGSVMAFFHFNVTHLTPSSLRGMIRAWEDWRPTFPGPLFMHFDEESQSRDRWVKMMGFVPVTELECTDGRSRTLYASFQ